MTTEIKRPCVLIVEDYRLARAMYRVTFEYSGFQVLEAADGFEALQRVGETMPDIILMDLSMPLMDGWKTTRFLKSDRRTAGIPIVVLSAQTSQGTAEDARRAGCVAVLPSPACPPISSRKFVFVSQSEAHAVARFCFHAAGSQRDDLAGPDAFVGREHDAQAVDGVVHVIR